MPRVVGPVFYAPLREDNLPRIQDRTTPTFYFPRGFVYFEFFVAVFEEIGVSVPSFVSHLQVCTGEQHNIRILLQYNKIEFSVEARVVTQSSFWYFDYILRRVF